MGMATELILMECVKAGGDRQNLHEAIRVHSMAAGSVVKNEGKPNDLIYRLSNDNNFKAVHNKLEKLIDPNLFIGRAIQQVDEFVKNDVDHIVLNNIELLNFSCADDVFI